MATAEAECSRCGKEFRYPYLLKRHAARKTPCAPILEETDLPPEALEDPDLAKKKCRFCGRVFASYTSMRRHVRESCRIAPNKKNGDEGMEVLYEHTLRKQAAQIDKLTALVRQQAAMLDQLTMLDQLAARAAPVNTGAAGVGIAGDHNAVVNSCKTININVFGKEGLDHVTMGRIREILDEALQAPALPAAADAAILRTAMIVYSDPERPENLTCYLPNKKTNDALVHTEGGWEVRPMKLVLTPMARKSVDMLFDRQPYEGADEYAPLMKELAENESRYAAGTELKPVLVRNKALLARALESLPLAGAE